MADILMTKLKTIPVGKIKRFRSLPGLNSRTRPKGRKNPKKDEQLRRPRKKKKLHKKSCSYLTNVPS